MPPASAYLTPHFPAPGLSLLLAWPWPHNWVHLTLPYLFALWYCCLPGLCCLGPGNKHSQPCLLCLCFLSLCTWFAFGVWGCFVVWTQFGPCRPRFQWEGGTWQRGPALPSQMASWHEGSPKSCLRSGSLAPSPSYRQHTSYLDVAMRSCPSHPYPSGTWSPAQQFPCPQASPVGPAGPRLGGGAMPGSSAMQGLEWQILQPGAQDRSPSPSLIYTPGALAWPYHPQPHQPPALGCGPCVCRALCPGQNEHSADPAQPAGHAHAAAEPHLHRAGSCRRGTRRGQQQRQDSCVSPVPQGHPGPLPGGAGPRVPPRGVCL